MNLAKFPLVWKILDRLCCLEVRVEFLATDPEVRVRFQAVPGVLRSLERGPLSLVNTIEELLGRKRSGSGLESREYGCKDSSR
jgi:hypothetical protein